jgi:nonsense-mediated mRNA decay protein 3
MCLACLKSQVDITEGFIRMHTVSRCPVCDRYLIPPAEWLHAPNESRELLAVCLRRIMSSKRAMQNEVRLTNAQFLWTEAHSKRLRVQVTLQRELYPGMVIQQQFPVDFQLHSQQCQQCCRVAAKDYWQALVQVRQDVPHKRTLFYLEQLISRHRDAFQISNIKNEAKGIDFYFATKSHALTLVEFIHKHIPCRYQVAHQLKSHDIHSNTYNTKTTFSVEVVPLCKDDIVCLPKALSQKLAYIGPLCVVHRVTDRVHLIDPQTAQMVQLEGRNFFANPFAVLIRGTQLSSFSVLDCDPLPPNDVQRLRGSAMGHYSKRHQLSDVYVVRESSLMDPGQQVHCRSHLGAILMPNDTVLGVDLLNANLNNDAFSQLSSEKIPDVILVTKTSGERKRRSKKSKDGVTEDSTSVVTDTDATLGSEHLEEDEVEFIKDFESRLVLEMSVVPESDQQLEGGSSDVKGDGEMEVDM